jgi:hypothetical protein
VFTHLIAGRRWGGPGHVKPAITLVFTACLLIAGALTADAATQDMRGSWALDVSVGSNRSSQTLEVSSMDMGTGTFRGDIIQSAVRASVAGTVSGSKVRFQSTPAGGAATDWSGDLSGNGIALKMSGTVTPGGGQSGTFSGSRVAGAVPLDDTHTPSSGRPPLPQGGREVSPGQLPRPCTTGETGMQGYYFSETAKGWVATLFCYGKWGNLEASGSQIVAPGATATVTAIPTDGSNSGTYAPQTQSIHWTYPGTLVSGCGAADLSCTVITPKVATTEWQWLEFHVSMPRTFFIDSPGDLCGGQHLCAGATTNAWSYVGIAPTGTAPGSAGGGQAPGVIGGGGPAGGQGTGGGGGGAPVGLILGTAVVLGAGATVVAARRNPLGASAATLGRVGGLISGMRPTGKSGGSTGTSAGPTGTSAGPTTGKGGGGKGGGMSQIDVTALGQQFQQMQQATHATPPAPPPEPPPVSPDPPP